MIAPTQSGTASRTTGPFGPGETLSVISATTRTPYVYLTEKESTLLELLAGNAGKPVGKDEILTELFAERHVDKNTLAVSVHNLRKKMRLRSDLRIDTVLNQGYMLSYVDPPLA